jgi:hypothetical protein
MDKLPSNPRAIYMKSLRVGQMTKLPLEHKGRYTHLRATWSRLGYLHWAVTPSTQFVSSRCKTRDPATCPRHRSFSACSDPISAHRASDLGFVAQPSNRRFCGAPPQTPRADSDPRLHFAFLVTMRPALDPVRPPSPLSQAYLSLHFLEAPQG